MLSMAKNGQQTALDAVRDLWAAGTSLRLFQNDITPGPNSLPGDFVVATFSGYAHKVPGLTLGPYLNPSGYWEVQNVSLSWAPSDGVTPNTIYGWYWLDAANNLIAAERFAEPRQMIDATSLLVVILSLQLLGTGIFGFVQPLDS